MHRCNAPHHVATRRTMLQRAAPCCNALPPLIIFLHCTAYGNSAVICTLLLMDVL